MPAPQLKFFSLSRINLFVGDRKKVHFDNLNKLTLFLQVLEPDEIIFCSTMTMIVYFSFIFVQEKRMVVPAALRVVRLKPGRKVKAD